MLIEKEKNRENQAFSSSIISHRIRIMREAAVRMESKHEETSKSNANVQSSAKPARNPVLQKTPDFIRNRRQLIGL